uniref:FBD domain-containing protein n=1 Tax=Steinernema glaseri TaxID=37863 RepID=A0A1I8AMQ4_9BILA
MDTVPLCFVEKVVIRTMDWLEKSTIENLKELTSYFGVYASFLHENAICKSVLVRNGEIRVKKCKEWMEDKRRRLIKLDLWHFSFGDEDVGGINDLVHLIRRVGREPMLVLTLWSYRLRKNVVDFSVSCNIAALRLRWRRVEGAVGTILLKLIAKRTLVICEILQNLNEETSQALLELLSQDQFQHLIIGCHTTTQRVLDHWRSAEVNVGKCVALHFRKSKSEEFVRDLLPSEKAVSSRKEELAIYSKLPYLRSPKVGTLHEWKSFHEQRRVYFNYYDISDFYFTSIVTFGVI